MWIEPLELAEHYAENECFALLYSARPAPDGSWRSLLAVDPVETITSGWEELAAALAGRDPKRWFGYLGYELGDGIPAAPLAFPPMWMTHFATVYAFDHHTQTIHLSPWERSKSAQTILGEGAVSAKPSPGSQARRPLPVGEVKVRNLASNMTRAEYLDHIAATLEQIRQGEFYQANITRKFYGEFETVPDAFGLYRSLTERSGAAYSAFLKIGDRAVLSSSPESFLSITAGGAVSTRPIKGTARRSGDPVQDARIYAELQESTKNRAENLMIVDLMRHDLSRSCKAGSVVVDDLFSLTEHPHLYHMASTVRGQKRPEVPPLQLIRDCFPPGSMTGAPKQAAIRWCRQREQSQRGVYSGALGWISGDGSAEFSVVIRTLLLQGNRFEFQVGGGIVADSTPESEWEETLTKAAGIAGALGISLDELRAL